MKANICKQWTKVITIIVFSNEQFCWDFFELFDLEIKGQGTPPYGHAPT